MDYYLYSHSNADGIFYIGKGCSDRDKENHMSKRSTEWLKASKNGYTSKIEANGTETDILALEKAVIKSLVAQGVNLVNKQHNPNWTPSAKSRQKMANAQRGRKHSKAVKQQMSDTLTEMWKHRVRKVGVKHTNAVKSQMSYSNRKAWQHRKLMKANEYGG